MSTALNGTPPVMTAEDPLAAHIEGLEAMLPALAAERGQIEAQLRDVTEREQRISDGIAGLRGKPAPKAAATTKVKKLGAKNPPSQKAKDDVYAAIARAPEPISVQELTDLDSIEIGRSAVQNVVSYLRHEERIRVAAKRGVTNLYAVMQ